MRSLHVAGALSLAIASLTAGTSSPPSIRGDVDHGRYLVRNVAMCSECHSPRDLGGALLEADSFLGAAIPLRAPPWPGEWALRAPRIRGLHGYDDAAATRLLTEGSIGRDGRRLKPPMPAFRMSSQDAADVIAYLRSLE